MSEQNENNTGGSVPPNIDIDESLAPAAASAPTEVKSEPVSTEDAEAPVWEGLPPLPDSDKVELTAEVFVPYAERAQEHNPNVEVLYLPSETEKRTEEFIANSPNEQLGNTPEEQGWANAMNMAELVRPRKDQFMAATEREGSAWRQAVPSEAGALGPGRPRIRDPQDSVVTGARAVQRIRSILGMGAMLQVPLWHSGFWITFRAPSDSALMELHRRISDAKVTLGRQTFGLAFANTSSYVARDVLNFALDHMHDSSLKGDVDVRKVLKVHDLQTIAWALACVIYTKGFQYSRPALVGEGQEKREVKGLVNVTKMFFEDTTMLTPWQVSHMSKRTGNSMSLEMIERYQEEFTLTQRQVELAPGLKMTLKVPTVDEYINSGHRWIAGIQEMVDEAFQEPPSDEQRDRYVTQQGKATVMRQFSHWIKSIDEDNDEARSYADDETIEEIVNTLSEDDDVRKKYFEAIHKFTDDTTISVVATPTVSEQEENRLPRWPRLVPIDALYTFFILLVQKTARISRRDDI